MSCVAATRARSLRAAIAAVVFVPAAAFADLQSYQRLADLIANRRYGPHRRNGDPERRLRRGALTWPGVNFHSRGVSSSRRWMMR